MAARERWEVAGEYADEAVSAWTGDRGPQLAAAMGHAELLAPCVLVVQHSDRLARGDGRTARHLGEIYFWAIKAGVELRSVQDDSTFTNPLLTFAMGERNAEDSRRKSLAVKAGMRRRAETGCGRPVAGRVGDSEPGAVAVLDEVEPVAADFVGRKQPAGQLGAGDSRNPGRKQVLLDLCGRCRRLSPSRGLDEVGVVVRELERGGPLLGDVLERHGRGPDAEEQARDPPA